jgi:hypothetical protein
MSLYVTVFAGSAPLGGLLAGSMAEAWGAPVAFSVGAATASAVLLLVAWRLRGVRMPEAGASIRAEPQIARGAAREAA